MFGRKRPVSDFNAEIEAHLQLEIERLKEQGLSEQEARAAARRAFGNVMHAEERFYESGRWLWWDHLRQDVHFGLRMLAKSPGFAVVAILTLALAIGANTAIFSVVDAVLLRPLPFRDPARLVWATEHFAFGPSTVISADFPAWKDRNHVLEQIAAFGGTSGANLTGTGEPSRVTVTRVTTGLFSMLALQPAAGRAFLPAEGKQGQDKVALLSETLWRNRFGADPRIIGETIRLDGVGYLVVGVMPANVRPQADVWTPLSFDADIFSAHSPRWMMLLATIGGLLGSITGLWATKILRQLIPAALPADVHFDPRIFGFSAAIIALALFMFGLIPALIASRTDVNETLKEGGLRLGASAGTHRLRGLMSVGEIGLSLILLVGAGLMVRSFLRLSEVDLGVDPNSVLLATVERPLTAAFDSQQHSAFFQSSLEKVRSLPGVKEAALTQRYPLGPPHNATMMLRVQGAENFRPSQPISVTAISPDYFHVMRIRLLKGRAFGDRDVEGAQKVVIVNESFSRMVFGGRDAIGQHIGFGEPSPTWKEVVGVVADAREDALEKEPGPEMFVPYLQQPSFSMTFMLRTESSPLMLAGGVREAVLNIDKNQPLSDTTTMEEVIAKSVAPRRFRMLVLGVCALLALSLAMIGVYGVIAYSSTQRTHEFGVRIALGAGRQDILKLVVRQGFKLALLGVTMGVAGALLLTRFLSGLLYEVSPHDPLTFAGVAALLMIVALAASYIPARRAMKLDPIVALRYE